MSFRIKENSLVVQWLGLCASTAGRTGSILAWELRSHMLRSQKKKKNPNIASNKDLLLLHRELYIQCQLQFGTCHPSLQGLNHVLLQLLTFNSRRSSGWRGEMRHSVLWEKLAEQVFR